MGTAIKHPVPDRVKPSFVIWRSDAQDWASECPDVKNYKWRLNPVWHRMLYSCTHMATVGFKGLTRKPSYRWQTPHDAKACQNCSNSTCLQRCRWQYWPIFMRLTAIASEIREIPRNGLKIQTYGVQGHPRSSILVSIESPYVTCY